MRRVEGARGGLNLNAAIPAREDPDRGVGGLCRATHLRCPAVELPGCNHLAGHARTADEQPLSDTEWSSTALLTQHRADRHDRKDLGSQGVDESHDHRLWGSSYPTTKSRRGLRDHVVFFQ